MRIDGKIIALAVALAVSSTSAQAQTLEAAFDSITTQQRERAASADLRHSDASLETIEESDSYILTMHNCQSYSANIIRKFPSLESLSNNINDKAVNSFKHLTSFYCSELSVERATFNIFYFGKAIGYIRPGEKFVSSAGGDWGGNELPEDSNIGSYFDGLNAKGSGQAGEINMMKALALGSAAAGLSIFWDYKTSQGHSTGGLSEDERAQKLAFLAYSLHRRYLGAVEYRQYVDSRELTLALDWVRQNPNVNPIDATFSAFKNTLSSDAKEKLALPTGGELLASANTYLMSICNHQGMVANAKLQRGDQPTPNPSTIYRVTPTGQCSMGNSLVRFALSIGRIERKSCEPNSAGGMDCAVSFQFACEPEGPACSVINAYPPIDAKLVLSNGPVWRASALIYDRAYHAPKYTPPTSDPYDLFSPENLPGTLLFLE